MMKLVNDVRLDLVMGITAEVVGTLNTKIYYNTANSTYSCMLFGFEKGYHSKDDLVKDIRDVINYSKLYNYVDMVKVALIDPAEDPAYSYVVNHYGRDVEIY